MDRMKNLFSKMLVAATLLSGAFFAACSDDDDNAALRLADLTGAYAGTFDFTPSPSDLNSEPKPESGIAIELNVENGKVVIPEFPATTLIKALLGEETGAGIAAMLNPIAYEAAIGTPTADETVLTANLTTPVLRIDIDGLFPVLITIESPDDLRYEKNGALTFTLKTTKCQLGEGDGAGEPFDLVNELKFTVTKVSNGSGKAAAAGRSSK